MSLRVLSAALAVGIGLVGVVVSASPAAAADPATPVQVAIAVPITVPESAGGLISGDVLSRYTAPLGTLSLQLDAVAGKPVSLGIDPRIIVSIRVLGSNAPESAVAWLQRLSAVSNEIFPLTYADSDITLATQAGNGTVLAPDGFDFAIDPTLFSAPNSTPTPTPTPADSPTPSATPPATADPTVPVVPALPTSADLEAWSYSFSGVAWPRDSTVVAADLPLITGSGYDTTVVSSDNLNRGAGAGAVADVDGARILVSDASVSAALRSAVHTFSSTDWQTDVATLNAAVASAGIVQSAATATVFATLDRTSLNNGTRLADTISAVQANPAIQLVTMADLQASPSASATVIDRPQDTERVVSMGQLLGAQAAEEQFAEIADDPRAITSERRLELLALQSNGWSNNPAGWPAVVSKNLTESVELLRSVQVASTGDFNFLAAAAPLPIAISNSLDQAVTVYVTVRPDTGLLAVGDSRVELVIEPNSQASAMIPAQAVSNGVVGITVTLTSSTGAIIGDASRARINVQAGWETPVVVIIAVLVVGIFGGGLVRNIVRLRRAAAARGAAE
ncbi:DUF6049 family protein [Salinibacterium sp. G-O1]|uniref:DUF6049 family protein n=1 Tax=Salinibacterium sp. G-O1 TaxID=3046208 RepID=UPI0024B98E12|nr:DUF6049 family protein [Salinibacterium sp. G-O1]MDJ0333698.1 DUF6049 family protein [Salinibacterium sp. G-O1]